MGYRGAQQLEDAGLRLRTAVLALRATHSFASKRSPAPMSSVFSRASAAAPEDTHPPVARALLRTRLRTVEASAMMPGTSLALVIAPSARIADELAPTCRQLVAGGSIVVLLGPGLRRSVTDRSQPLTVPLRADDGLAREWGLIAVGPERRVAFLARSESDELDAWSWLLTRDSIAVHRAGMAVLERVPFLRLRIPSLLEN